MTFALSADGSDLVEDYLDSVEAAGMKVNHTTRQAVREFAYRVGGPTDWSRLTSQEKGALPNRLRRVATWMVATGRVPAPTDYLVAVRTNVGEVAAHHHQDLYESFLHASRELGFEGDRPRRQWSALCQVAAVSGVAPAKLDADMLSAGRDRLFVEYEKNGRVGYAWALSMFIFQAAAVLFHIEVIDRLPPQRGEGRVRGPHPEWELVPTQLRKTATAYLEQIDVVLRPSTVRQIGGSLREFCVFVSQENPAIKGARDIARPEVEAYKVWLNKKASARSKVALTRGTVAKRLGYVANFFQRIIEWDWDDAPPGVPVLPGDKPIVDERLPRFIDDGAATKLLVATRADDDPFVRLAVEFLARTGLRIGEFLDLTIDAVVQIGSSFWLRVPVGKLHNDRYIPLHPQLKVMLDAWLASRPETLRSPYMFIEKGRRIRYSRVVRALDKVTSEAGIERVTPHQLRHTLATQAINRGMSLEALAALLGHKTLSMTLVYARIADRTVADEYFAVSEKVEALYDKAAALPADAEGSKMTKLRNEMSRRMLGNGYCARPVDLDCHFESICESCTFFVTTVDFKPTLERQRDDAEAKGQVARKRIFDGLLTRLEQDAS